ncbi:hypothetical protein BCR44DRAFT_72579 [Catenaria anguillulae PL171]|uniref:Transmembrane protein 230 n=1 Tax=Catenaria anguillulae PL171 TaxID=765915 RepID=A0A1Y2HV11_9FUNG|nr:hypothetical protein BCR44DRAFT_72579 [Catenaria anguillulae PL171]
MSSQTLGASPSLFSVSGMHKFVTAVLFGASQDSYQSLIDDDDIKVDPALPAWKNPLIWRYPRTICAAFTLMFIGLMFVFVFIGNVVADPSRALVFGLVALFTFLPGSYVSTYIYLSLSGASGYKMKTLPSFDK